MTHGRQRNRNRRFLAHRYVSLGAHLVLMHFGLERFFELSHRAAEQQIPAAAGNGIHAQSLAVEPCGDLGDITVGDAEVGAEIIGRKPRMEIGVMLPDGQIRSAMYHKFRQINRYLEFVNDILPNLPAEGALNVVDFGCGKSYLTFALHHLLTRIHHREVSIVGLDIKDEVIADCNRIAQVLGCAGLRFEVGRIESFCPSGHVHLAVSLHACDTATDEALAGAIRWNCEVILAVPCCQHELNDTLDKNILSGLTEYGILRERFASMATDALRAKFLEWKGYRTQILEFIDLEHTPKNLLLRAIRRSGAMDDDESRRTAYEHLKKDLGLASWHLENVMSPE